VNQGIQNIKKMLTNGTFVMEPKRFKFSGWHQTIISSKKNFGFQNKSTPPPLRQLISATNSCKDYYSKNN
jgi:hypothetical protein